MPAALLFIGVVAAGEGQASLWDGVYTQQQASRGQALYGKQCASCHGDDLSGQGQAPPLSGNDFKENWNGQTVGDLFERIRVSMPADHPGQLTADQNADILTFIFRINGFPAGKAELPSDSSALKRIRFEIAKTKKE